MKRIILASLILILSSSCAQVALTGNITNVTVIKVQESKDDAIMSGSDLDARDLNLRGGDAEIPLK